MRRVCTHHGGGESCKERYVSDIYPLFRACVRMNEDVGRGRIDDVVTDGVRRRLWLSEAIAAAVCEGDGAGSGRAAAGGCTGGGGGQQQQQQVG